MSGNEFACSQIGSSSAKIAWGVNTKNALKNAGDTRADIRLGVYGPLHANDLHVKSMQRRDRQSCGVIRANEAARMARITRRELSV